MPVEILHDSVGSYHHGDLVDASVFGSQELRRLLDLQAVRMVPTNSPEKPLELTQEQASIVQANTELSDRLDALESENQALRLKLESEAHSASGYIRTLTQDNTELRAQVERLMGAQAAALLEIEALKKVQTSAPEPKQPKKK